MSAQNKSQDAGKDDVSKEAVSVKLSANLEIPAGASPRDQVAKLVDVVFDLLGQAGKHVAADSCSVSCSIASSLLAAAVNNGHAGCVCNACGDVMAYAMGAALSGKPDKKAMH